MDTYPQPHQPDPSLDLAKHAYYQLVHTLTGILPPPLADTPEALLTRNQAAIAQVAAMLPVNANEAGFAAQCIAARAQAEDVMRLIRVHAGDIQLVIKLNAQYIAMVRASLGAHGHLLRAQAVRHKREQSGAALSADDWTQHIATRSMQQALDADPLPAAPAAEYAAPATPVTEEPRPPAAEDPLAPAPQTAPVAQSPAPAEAPNPPPASASLPIPARAATFLPAPAAPMPPPAPRRSRHMTAPEDADDPPRNLPTEADHYALIYPRRAQEIRKNGGLPPDCSFGPPDDDLVHALVTGTTPALRALDSPNAAMV
jgi:hypothetical protein